jgi:L-lactate dehydrogenase complex protein LldF
MSEHAANGHAANGHATKGHATHGHPESMPTYLGMPPFPEAAATALGNAQLRRNLAHATSTIRAKRAAAVAELADWQQLRAAGKAIKDHTLAHLDTYLTRLEERVTDAGGHVHWAQDAAEANSIVTSLVRAAGADSVVKVKSMTTQETGLNEALAAEHITALETDLAELIVQLGHDRPSHILVPATATGPRSGTSSWPRWLMCRAALPTPRPNSPPPPVPTCAARSCPPGSASPARTSPSPRPAAWWWWSPRATAGCASRCRRR